MKNGKPLVSIIMPTYNRPHTLERAINSCLAQTYDNIEIIVIDDNNPDTEARHETIKTIGKYKNNQKIKYIKLEHNSGACVARNKGIELSKGEYITFLDDDDEFLPNNIEKEIQFMQQYNFDVIFCDTMIVDENTKKTTTFKYRHDFELNKKSLLRKHLIDIISGGISFVYKRKVLIEIGGFYNIPASQEYILMLNTILGDYKIGYYEFIGTKSYTHTGTSGITGSLKAIEAKKEVIKLVKPYLYYLTFWDRRKVLFRLNSFIFIQYFRRRSINCVLYGIKLIFYIDLLIIKLLNKRKKVSNGDVTIFK